MKYVAGLLALLALFACAPKVADADWAGYGGPDENHYSPLKQIDAGNVGRLGLAWHHDIDVGGSSLTAPVEAGGVLYFAGGLSVVHALDATTGKLLWQYDPKVGEAAGERLRSAWGSRGVAYAKGRVFVGTIDGRLIAIDAKTGKPVWSALTTEPGDQRYVSGAPWVFRDKVVIGHGGADFAPVRGYVTAYDQATGRQAWRFYTVPGDPAKGFENAAMAMAAKTWTGKWWKYGGGGTAWNAMAYDAKLNRIYIGTGNGSPWNRKIRSPQGGDNLFVCSIIALDADTGAYVWHYQTNPGETWDFNSAMDIELADLKVDGKLRPVILHAPKNGFFYVIDRQTGKLLSAKNYVPVNWATGIDPKTGRPVENPEARFPDGKAAIVYPSPFGAHNIEAMSFNPATGLVYVPAMDQGRVYVDPPGKLSDWTYFSGQRISNGIGAPPEGLNPRKPSSMLIAWNPATQTEAWRVPMQGPRGGGGTATTAGGLVFQGRGSGQFTALDAMTGKLLWSFKPDTAVMAQPITYAVKGKQYVAVIAGARFPTAQGLVREWSYRTQKWRVLAFALGGKDKLPAPDLSPTPWPDDAGLKIDAADAKAGAGIYAQRCAICHGAAALSGGAAPDLLRSPVPTSVEALTGVLHEGIVDRGMPKFGELTANEIRQIQAYLRQRAHEVQAAEAGKAKLNRGRDEGQ